MRNTLLADVDHVARPVVAIGTDYSPDTLLDFNSLLGAPGAAAGGLSAYAVIGDNFGVFVNALETNRNFTAISRPTIFGTLRLAMP